MTASSALAKPVRAFGGFIGMSLDTFVVMFRPPFAWREYLLQTWFVARVSVLPALMLTLPYSVLLVFTFNILLGEFGAADFSGTGAAIGTVNQIGPIVTVLVVSGAGATAMCADLGARTIREELDALRVMGIDPVQALVVPRVLAATTVALALSSTVILTGLAGAYIFVVYIQNVSPGAFAAGLTLLTGVGDVFVSLTKATLFGLAAGLIACYKGISVGGGPATLPVLAANLASVGQVGIDYKDSIEQLLVVLPQAVGVGQGTIVANANTKQAYKGEYLSFNLNVNLPPACTTGFLPAQQARTPSLVDYPDRAPGDLYCRVPQDSQFNVRGARNIPCETVPGKRAPTVKMCESNEQYVPLNDGNNWKGDPNATLSGQDIPQLPPGAAPPPLTMPTAPPPPALIGVDGYAAAPLPPPAKQDSTWQSMLTPAGS